MVLVGGQTLGSGVSENYLSRIADVENFSASRMILTGREVAAIFYDIAAVASERSKIQVAVQAEGRVVPKAYARGLRDLPQLGDHHVRQALEISVME